MPVEFESTRNLLASRRRRVLAFIVDSIVLSLLCWAVALAAGDMLVAIGDWGRLIGVALFVGYFAVFDSSMVDRASPGKALLGIRVKDPSGAPLSPLRAAGRAGGIALPAGVNNLYVNVQNDALMLALSALLSIALFGVALSLVYMFFFNWRRQGLHDWLVNALVVYEHQKGACDTAAPERIHLAVVAVLIIVSGFLPIFAQQFATGVAGGGMMDKLVQAQASVLEHKDVINARVQLINPGTAEEYLQATVDISSKLQGREVFVRALGDSVRSALPDMTASDPVLIVLRRAWTMGIASGYKSQRYCACPGSDIVQQPT